MGMAHDESLIAETIARLRMRDLQLQGANIACAIDWFTSFGTHAWRLESAFRRSWLTILTFFEMRDTRAFEFGYNYLNARYPIHIRSPRHQFSIGGGLVAIEGGLELRFFGLDAPLLLFTSLYIWPRLLVAIAGAGHPTSVFVFEWSLIGRFPQRKEKGVF